MLLMSSIVVMYIKIHNSNDKEMISGMNVVQFENTAAVQNCSYCCWIFINTIHDNELYNYENI